jgi:hypothetical protein
VGTEPAEESRCDVDADESLEEEAREEEEEEEAAMAMKMVGVEGRDEEERERDERADEEGDDGCTLRSAGLRRMMESRLPGWARMALGGNEEEIADTEVDKDDDEWVGLRPPFCQDMACC